MIVLGRNTTGSSTREWVVMLACFLLVFSNGSFFTLTVFFTSFEAEFGWNRALISSVHSTFLIVAAGSNVIVGWLTDRYGHKQVLVACGLLMGLGLSLCSQVHSFGQFILFYAIASLGVGASYVMPTAMVQRLVSEKRRGLALGTTVAGLSAARLVFFPLGSFLLLSTGWRTSYIVLGGITWLLFFLAAILIPSGSRRKSTEVYSASQHGIEETLIAENMAEGSHSTAVVEQRSFIKIMTSKTFLLVSILFMFPIMTNQLLVVHTIPFTEGLGIGKTAAAAAFGLTGVSGIAG
ncbi:MFS transporter, partial [Chloroflexota bacterium]